MIGLQNLEKVLAALDRQIGIYGGSPLSLVVCGGTALAALGLVDRTTKDVDVLAQVDETKEGPEIRKIDKFPPWLIEAANIVARDFGLSENWLNLGPALQVESGLPDGFGERLVKIDYGRYLTVYYISRMDQIYFKLYAAVDRNDYHVQDLFALNPTHKEIEREIGWVLTQDVSEGFRFILKGFLEKHGYEVIAKRI